MLLMEPFTPLDLIESAFQALLYIAGTYPELMAIVNYFELTYFGLAQPDGTYRVGTKFSRAQSFTIKGYRNATCNMKLHNE